MGPFDWCYTGQHDRCKREYERTYTDPRNNSVVHTDEMVYCECKTRSCPCYVPAKERAKKKRAPRRKK